MALSWTIAQCINILFDSFLNNFEYVMAHTDMYMQAVLQEFWPLDGLMTGILDMYR